jgi:hypothetical protein
MPGRGRKRWMMRKKEEERDGLFEETNIRIPVAYLLVR